MIRVVCGHIGHGKTLYALALMEQAVRAGRPVFTNIRLKPECPVADRVAFIDDEDWLVCGTFPITCDLREVVTKKDAVQCPCGRCGKYQAFWHFIPRNAVVVIDEADWYFDCTDHSAVGRDVRLFHKQVRKYGIDLVYIVQHVPNLYVRLRRLTTSFIVCEWNYRSSRLFSWLPVGLSRFLRSEFSSDVMTKDSHMADGYWRYDEAEKYFGWYDTGQLLGDVGLATGGNEALAEQSGRVGVVLGRSGEGLSVFDWRRYDGKSSGVAPAASGRDGGRGGDDHVRTASGAALDLAGLDGGVDPGWYLDLAHTEFGGDFIAATFGGRVSVYSEVGRVGGGGSVAPVVTITKYGEAP